MAENATVARPYAEALFRVAQAGKESFNLAAWSNLVSELAQVGSHPEVQAFARNPKASESDVASAILALVKSPLNAEAKNFLAMLIENGRISLLPEIGGAKISLQRLLGYVMAPVCWLMGLPWPQAITAGSLMGTKTVLNELIAYVDLSKLGPDALDPRSRLIMLYAMCGFANFASLGIMIGGLGIMAPTRRDEINALGLKSIVSGTLTTCLMGAIVGAMT